MRSAEPSSEKLSTIVTRPRIPSAASASSAEAAQRTVMSPVR